LLFIQKLFLSPQAMMSKLLLYSLIGFFSFTMTAGLAYAQNGGNTLKMPGKSKFITLFMTGDVMTGRGIDQVLPSPSDPVIYEPYVKDARDYVAIAEQANGSIQEPVGFSYIWGEALGVLDRVKPDVRLINLETSVTSNSEFWPGKGIQYRMHPANIGCLPAAKIDYCSLANNHVLDWHHDGLLETLVTLKKAGIKNSGAGRNQNEAAAPAILDVPGKGRVVIFSFGLEDSGIPGSWTALHDTPGVNLLPDLSGRTIDKIKEQVTAVKKPGDIVVASIHWGGNWGYGIPPAQTQFAHRLIDGAGVDIIHGHSSHHPRPIEVHKDKLIIYGAGDFLNDYEGIGGHESFRGDLALMYFATVDPETGELVSLEMTPTITRRFKVNLATQEDARWLQETLNRENKKFGTSFKLHDDNSLILKWD
jgi:poly-gamma-glutamate synthesis protein (capsule biosynthesis protein)